ncbi:MAG: hypothetical protein PWQ10_132 [Patescibacteria group bacterium]|nr:hypothetical protein [Patescibacteria group bacterium]
MLSEKPQTQNQTNKSIVFIVGIITFFLICLTFYVSSFKTTETTVDCTSFFAQGLCQSGYVKQKANDISFNPENIFNIAIIPIIIAIFAITTILLTKNDKRTKIITFSSWFIATTLTIIALLVYGSTVSSKLNLLPGGLSQDEFNCIDKNRIALIMGTAAVPCVGDAANKPTSEYWND